MVLTAKTHGRLQVISTGPTKLFINNQFVDPIDGGTLDTLNPATGEKIATVSTAGPRDVDRAVKAARAALANSAHGAAHAAA